ncbi:MAG: cell wall hydrolase [Pseudomonadota bacterium]
MRDARSRLPLLGSVPKILTNLTLVFGIGLGSTTAVQADTGGTEPTTYRVALTDALDAEHTAFPAFAATDQFVRAAGLDRLDTDNPYNEFMRIRARAMVDDLSDEDVHAVSIAKGMQAAMNTQAAITLGGPITDAMLATVDVTDRSEEWYCLTEALYFEARGESRTGQLAVAEVILNRVDSKSYPASICGVVQQGMHRRNACQFSYNCDGRKNTIGNKPVFEELGKLAWMMMEGKPRSLTSDALFYHATSVKPRWARRFVRTARIGAHIFYRPTTQLSQN